MEQEKEKEVRYDTSGKKIVTFARDKDTQNAILAINDKLDQLLGILSSTLPTKIGSEIRQAASGTGGEDLKRLTEIISSELPERLKKDSDQNVFEKAEMLSVVISTSIQHLQDAFKSYQDALLEAMNKLTAAQELTNTSLKELHVLLGKKGDVSVQPANKQIQESPQVKKPAEKPSLSTSTFTPSARPQQPDKDIAPDTKETEKTASAPSPQEKTEPAAEKETGKDVPGWLQSGEEKKDTGWPPSPPTSLPKDSPGGTD